MRRKLQQNGRWLLSIAKEIVSQLKSHSRNTPIHIRRPNHVQQTLTNGWSVRIGDLGKGQAKLEIWYDRFSGHADRKLNACFYSGNSKSIQRLTKDISRNLWPVRVVTIKDTISDDFVMLNNRLKRDEFNVPILETYIKQRHHFFGFYDPTRIIQGSISTTFYDRAVAFYLDVAQSLPKDNTEDILHDIYPKEENRKFVTSHIQRERSHLLAVNRKILDKFRCQVCGMRFEDAYGKTLGQDFAEAHHIVPLSKLKGRVRTRIEDLRTVCANCHRMLHRMDGKRDDVVKLKSIVGKHLRKRK